MEDIIQKLSPRFVVDDQACFSNLVTSRSCLALRWSRQGTFSSKDPERPDLLNLLSIVSGQLKLK